MSLDTLEPIFYKLNIDKDNELLKKDIYNYIFKECSKNHNLVYKYYKYFNNNINNLLNDVNEYNKSCPQYIKDFFKGIEDKLDDDDIDKKKLLEKYNDKEKFIEMLNKKLIKVLNQFFNS